MKIIDIKPNTPEWLEYRRGGIGASDIPAIMGLYPASFRCTIKDVWKEKKGLGLQKMSSAMARGHEYEEEARRVFNREFFHTFDPVICEHEDFPHFRASLDGYSSFNRELVEIKIPNVDVLDMARMGQVPIYYLYQMQWQMFVSGAVKGYFFCYHPESFAGYKVEVYPDDEIVEKMIKRATEFWHCILIDKEPDLPVTTKRMSDYSEEKMMLIEKNNEIIDRLTEENKRYAADVRDFEGEEISLECDRYLYLKCERETVDYKSAALDSGIDISQYRKPKTIYWTLKVKKD